MITLYEGHFLKIEKTEDERTIWVTRNEHQEPTVERHLEDLAAFERTVRLLPIAKMRLVFDARRGPGRNDPEFERRVIAEFNRIADRFEAVGMLVATQVGKLHAKRNRESHFVFTDEAEARRFAGL